MFSERGNRDSGGVKADSLASMIASVDVRATSPRRFANSVMGFLRSHGSSQLEELSSGVLFAAHLKARLNDVYLDLAAMDIECKMDPEKDIEELDRKYGRVYAALPRVLDLYENVEKFRNNADSALDVWMRIHSAITVITYLDAMTEEAMAKAQMTEQRVESRIEGQRKLLQVYAMRLGELGSDGEAAKMWFNKFDGTFMESVHIPFMLDRDIIESKSEYDYYRDYPVHKKLKEELRTMGEGRET